MAKPSNRAAPELTDFAVRLSAMHMEAHRLGLYATGYALHEAVRKVGFEIADLMDKPSPTGAKHDA
jgi:hypothetical protein